MINTTESPCIGVCELGQQQFCLGCGRTNDEIAGWMFLSTEQQQAVSEKAGERLFAEDKA